MERICIYPKDIQIITGRTERYGRLVVKRIKKLYNKQPHQLVSIEEFCAFMGLAVEEVKSQLK